MWSRARQVHHMQTAIITATWNSRQIIRSSRPPSTWSRQTGASRPINGCAWASVTSTRILGRPPGRCPPFSWDCSALCRRTKLCRAAWRVRTPRREVMLRNLRSSILNPIYSGNCFPHSARDCTSAWTARRSAFSKMICYGGTVIWTCSQSWGRVIIRLTVVTPATAVHQGNCHGMLTALDCILSDNVMECEWLYIWIINWLASDFEAIFWIYK